MKKAKENKIAFLKKELKSNNLTELEKSFLEFILREEKERKEIQLLKLNEMITKRVEGRIVSFVIVHLEAKDNLFFHFVYTKKEERRKGYAKELLAEVMEIFKTKTYTANPMPHSVRILEELGFEITKTELEYWAEKSIPKNENKVNIITEYEENEELIREKSEYENSEWVINPYIIKKYKNSIKTKEVSLEKEFFLKKERGEIIIIE